jgi:two-component system KDP operon response regulator KdpE
MHEANVLVVTDDPTLRRALRTVMGAKGYEVTVIDGSEDVLDLSRLGRYDLVLVDNDLYDNTSFEVCKAIRSASEIPLIIMSADTSEELGVSVVREIVSGQLRKPFGVSELFACLQDIVEKPVEVSLN